MCDCYRWLRVSSLFQVWNGPQPCHHTQPSHCGLTHNGHCHHQRFNNYDSQAQPNWLYVSNTIHRPTVWFKFDHTLILHTQNCPLQCVIITNISDKFVPWHAINHFTLMQPLKPGNDNTYALTQHKDVQNLRCYTCIMIYKSHILTSPKT